MIGRIKCGTAVAMIGVAATLTGSLQAGAAVVASPQTAAAGWRVYATVGHRGQTVLLGNVDAVSPGDAWVAGTIGNYADNDQRALLEHWNGRSWRQVALPTRAAASMARQSALLFAAAMPGSDVWVFNVLGNYLRLCGTRWTSGTIAPARNRNIYLDQAVVFGPADVWVFGLRVIGALSRLDFRPFAAHFDGRTWTTVAVPGNGAMAVSAVSPRDLWAITGMTIPGAGIPSRPRILRWNGSAWRSVSIQPKLSRGSTLTTILAESPANVWIGGSAPNRKTVTSELARHWNGKSWVTVDPPANASGDDYYIAQLARDGAGGMWAVSSNIGASDPGPGRIRHYSRGAWSAPVTLSSWVFPSLAWVPQTRSVWGIAGGPGLINGLIILHGAVPR